MVKVSTFALVAATAAVLFSPQAPLADAADIETLRVECGTQLNLGTAGCNCIADTAADQLNDNQQALVAAMVTQNQPRADEVRGQMTLQEITQSAEFMVTAPQLCATQ